MFYVEIPSTQPRIYERTEARPARGSAFEATPEFVVHSKMYGSHEKAQPYVVRGVNRQGRLLVQTLVATEYDPIGRWHEVECGDTVEGYRFKRYALKPLATIIKIALTTAKTRARTAAKQEKLADRAEKCGTCPVCFGDFVVVSRTVRGLGFGGRDQWSMVHHGYERPGIGYIVGDCHGVGFEPFEVSCAGTKSWLEHLGFALKTRQEALVNLSTRAEITIEISVRRSQGRTQIETRTLRRGDDGFDRAVEARRIELTNEVASITRHIAEYEVRIAEWAPKPFPRTAVKSSP